MKETEVIVINAASSFHFACACSIFVLTAFASSSSSPAGQDSPTPVPDKLRQLQAGASVTPTVEVTRRGRILKLDYKLVDAHGQKQSNRQRARPPQFAVYEDGKEIGSGSFRYG